MAILNSESAQAPSKETLLRSLRNPDQGASPESNIRKHGQTLIEEEKYQEALPFFRGVAKDFGSDIWFVNAYSQALVGVGGRENVANAVHLLNHAAEGEGGDNVWIHVGLGEALGRYGDYEAARAQYQTARQLNPDTVQVAFLRVLDEGDEQRWLQEADRLHTQGKAMVDEGHIHRGLKEIDKAIILAGEDARPWIVYAKAEALEQNGNTEEAVTAYWSAARGMPEVKWPRLRIAALYQQMGETEIARAHYEWVLDIDPNDTTARAAMEAGAQREEHEEQERKRKLLGPIQPGQRFISQKLGQIVVDEVTGSEGNELVSFRTANQGSRRRPLAEAVTTLIENDYLSMSYYVGDTNITVLDIQEGQVVYRAEGRGFRKEDREPIDSFRNNIENLGWTVGLRPGQQDKKRWLRRSRR